MTDEDDIVDPLADVEILPSVRDRMVKSLGRDIRLDYFLYSVREAIATLDSMEKLAPEGHSQVAVAFAGDGDGFIAAVRELARWYRQKYETLSFSAALDYELLGDVLDPIAYFVYDLKVMAKKSGQEIPFIGAEPPGFWRDCFPILKEELGRTGDWLTKYLAWEFRCQEDESVIPGSRPPIGRYAPRIESV